MNTLTKLFDRLTRRCLSVSFHIDEVDDLRTMLDGPRWKSFCFDFDQYLREQYKYHGNDAAGDIRDKFYEMLNDANLNLHE